MGHKYNDVQTYKIEHKIITYDVTSENVHDKMFCIWKVNEKHTY